MAYQKKNIVKITARPAVKELISFYEITWHLKREVPTLEEVYAHLRKKFPAIKYTSIAYYLGNWHVAKALDDRGIPWRQHSREDLTPTQVAVATVMSNFADGRTNAEKLNALGVNPATYFTWMLDPKFKNAVQSMADYNIKNIDAVAKVEYAKKIQEGYWPTIKHYVDTTQAVTGNEMPQSEVMIRMLIEIIQKHVKDADVLMAIAEDMKRASANRTLETATLSGVVVSEDDDEDDEDLARAKRMIGFG